MADSTTEGRYSNNMLVYDKVYSICTRLSITAVKHPLYIAWPAFHPLLC